MDQFLVSQNTPERRKSRKNVTAYPRTDRQPATRLCPPDLTPDGGSVWYNCIRKSNDQKYAKNHCLAKSIVDVPWNQFAAITENKAEEAGSHVILMNPRNTTQMCSRCDMVIKKTLSDRVHTCPHCRLTMDRDQNAAINIMRSGLQSLG